MAPPLTDLIAFIEHNSLTDYLRQNSTLGAPGWLSRLSIQLGFSSGHDLTVYEFDALFAILSLSLSLSLCLSLSLSLSLCPSPAHAISVSLKINK